MIRTRSCSWCHELNRVGPGRENLCGCCGHRADVSRQECDCPTCRPQTPPGTTPMPFRAGQRELALSLFYNVTLPTVGNGTLSEAEEQACLMLAAGELYDACKAMLAAFGNCGSPLQQEAADKVSAAIKKATLREP